MEQYGFSHFSIVKVFCTLTQPLRALLDHMLFFFLSLYSCACLDDIRHVLHCGSLAEQHTHTHASLFFLYANIYSWLGHRPGLNESFSGCPFSGAYTHSTHTLKITIVVYIFFVDALALLGDISIKVICSYIATTNTYNNMTTSHSPTYLYSQNSARSHSNPQPPRYNMGVTRVGESTQDAHIHKVNDKNTIAHCHVDSCVVIFLFVYVPIEIINDAWFSAYRV